MRVINKVLGTVALAATMAAGFGATAASADETPSASSPTICHCTAPSACAAAYVTPPAPP